MQFFVLLVFGGFFGGLCILLEGQWTGSEHSWCLYSCPVTFRLHSLQRGHLLTLSHGETLVTICPSRYPCCMWHSNCPVKNFSRYKSIFYLYFSFPSCFSDHSLFWGDVFLDLLKLGAHSFHANSAYFCTGKRKYFKLLFYMHQFIYTEFQLSFTAHKLSAQAWFLISGWINICDPTVHHLFQGISFLLIRTNMALLHCKLLKVQSGHMNSFLLSIVYWLI